MPATSDGSGVTKVTLVDRTEPARSGALQVASLKAPGCVADHASVAARIAGRHPEVEGYFLVHMRDGRSNICIGEGGRRGVALTALLLMICARVDAQERGSCAPLRQDLGVRIEEGWTRYRAGEMARAEQAFREVLAACPRDVGAANGAAYVALRQGSLTLARSLFERILKQAPRDYDALVGRGLAAYRTGDLSASRWSFEQALRVVPQDSTSLWYLEQLRGREQADTLSGPLVRARAGQRVFEVPDGSGGWNPIWIKGVNLGAALPGRFPAEFPPDDGTYERWIELFAQMQANTIRVFTIHPPHFYSALRRWNLGHPDRPLWLIHGVWAELPPGKHEERYDDPAWKSALRSDMRSVVDLVHGNASLAARPGHASGRYDSDVSPWVLAYVLGREWEPHSVMAYAKSRPKAGRYDGRFVRVAGGMALDVWLGEQMDFLVAYEMSRYNEQRPIAYTNWPTLDPLAHVTESTRLEEFALRAARGERIDEPNNEYDNDAIGLDARKLRATAAYPAGVFASYHVYPYYPDFMVLDPAYNRAASPEGRSNYYGYLRELVEHHGDMPLVIAEFGVPSSRGMAHWQPQGWHHGGHDERAQAAINARLTRDIHAAGAAGAVLFSAIDEWFKHNWLVIDFEQPAERNRLWLNVLDAEQHYGVIAMRPGQRDSVITIDGRADDWSGTQPLYRGGEPNERLDEPLRLRGLSVRSDEAYVYLRLDVGTVDWRRAHYLIGIDTYLPGLGDRRFPYTRERSAVGFEFMLELRGPEQTRLLVDSPYNLYRVRPIRGSVPPDSFRTYNRPFRTVPNVDGKYDSLRVTSNRRRIGRDGVVYGAFSYERGLLRHARQSETSLADWYADSAAGVIEIRLGWGMLNVLDPSSRRVLFGNRATGDVDGVRTDGFRFEVRSFDPRDPTAPGDRLPAGGVTPATWVWSEWDQPRWYAEVKPLFESMREVFGSLGAPPARPGVVEETRSKGAPRVRPN
ncbi:MAG: tetratricopeptide repeat protein [Gemmatimonadaceae bacterium]